MKIVARKISARKWTALGVSLAALGGVLVLRHIRPVPAPASALEISALRAELATFPSDSGEQLAALHQHQAARSAPTDPVATMQSTVGARWRWVPGKADNSILYGKLAAAEPAACRWPEIVGAMETLEGMPGLTVEAIDLATGGTRTARHFVRVELHVRLQGPDGANKEHLPPGEFHPADRVPGRDLPAGPREVGRSRALAGLPPAPPARPAAGSGSRPGAPVGPTTRDTGLTLFLALTSRHNGIRL